MNLCLWRIEWQPENTIPNWSFRLRRIGIWSFPWIIRDGIRELSGLRVGL